MTLMYKLAARLAVFRQSQKGQAVVEYAGALVLATIVVAAAVAVLGTGATGKIGTLFTNILNDINTYFSGKVPT